MTDATQLHPGTPREAGLDSARVDHVKDRCRAWVEQDVHKALAVLVARRGVIALHEAFGPIGPHGAPPLQRDSIFPMASLSKVVTATALMVLVEDGLVGLTRPVQEYVPEFVGAGKEDVCIHHLLTHTSGLREEFLELVGLSEPSHGRQSHASEPTLHPLVAEELPRALDAPLSTKPGGEMFYCNHNFRLAGEIVRRVSGSALADFASSRIFEPLRMRDTSYILPDELSSRTIGWSVAPPAVDRTTTREFRKSPFPDGGVFSTPLDMATFGQMFLNGGRHGDDRILSSSAAAEMTRDQIPGIRANVGHHRDIEASWGYGWGIAGNAKWLGWPTFPVGTFAHSGGGAMMLWADPVHEIVAAYFSICRYRPTIDAFEPVTNVDLFVNAVTAAIVD